jgi:hypothetical protein
MSRNRIAGAVLAAFVIVVVASTPALAAASLDVSTTYSGTEGDDQRVEVEMTLSPNGSAMSDVVIDIGESDRAFVDFNSFSTTVTPGSADVNVTYEGDGRFTIAELPSEASVTISYMAYPRTIKEESLTVSTIDVSYVQNGQQLNENQQVEADLSNSPWFQLQQAQSSSGQLRILGIAGGAILVIGGLVGIWVLYKKFIDTEPGGGFD